MDDHNLTAPNSGVPGVYMEAEIGSQPATWSRVLAEPAEVVDLVPGANVAVAVAGCGTSYYMGASYARRRERIGWPTRALVASEVDRLYRGEVLVVVSRSGTTRDLVDLAALARPTTRVVGIVGTPGSPLTEVCHDVIMLDYADEESVVQTRFATTALTLLRRSLGEDLDSLVPEAERALKAPLPGGAYDHAVFLGSGSATALANEAALKCLEAAAVWSEAYAVGEYLHGPVAAAQPGTLVWSLSPVPGEVADVIGRTGAELRTPGFDSQVELVNCQRLALALARRAGRDPDHPRYLSRSVV